MSKDPFQYFRIEAKELVEELSANVLHLERSEPDFAGLVPRLLRLTHTLKGAARVVKQIEIAELAHVIEDALTPLRESKASAPAELVNSLLGHLDRISELVAALTPPGANLPGDTSVALVEVPPMLPMLRADVGEMDALLRGLTESCSELAALRQDVDALRRAEQLAELLTLQLASPHEQRSTSSATAELRSLAEDLRTQLITIGRHLASHSSRIDTELRQACEGAERLRLLPAGLMFHALERTTRDVAQSLGKRVVFKGSGGDVQLDAHALSVLQHALVQIVRNAVAHGIENEHQRTRAGKTPEGHITLEIAHRGGGRIELRCSDDGQGIDLGAVRRAAEQAGLAPSEARGLDLAQAVRLLLKGGISTSRVVTGVSGRGVGLDVVRETASRLGGEITLQSEVNRGTTLTLLVPASLSSLDALLVEAAGQRVAFPLNAVRCAARVAPAEIVQSADATHLVLDGSSVPLRMLTSFLRCVPSAHSARASHRSVVVLVSTAGSIALAVDRVLGIHHIVWRPLPELTPADTIVTGVALDADGAPRLLLDPAELVASADRLPVQREAPRRPGLPLLIVDDSLTTRTLEQSILESAGFEVDLASSAEEALEKARGRAYGLFLVDIEMPGMDGFELLEHARSDPALAHVPSILVSSRSSPEDRRRAERLGVRGYVIKSEFDQSDLLTRIRQLVE